MAFSLFLRFMEASKMKLLSVNRRGYFTEEGCYIEVKTVLVEGQIGDYAAYIGIGSDDYVMRRGDKISFEETQIHFPIGLVKERYRL